MAFRRRWKEVCALARVAANVDRPAVARQAIRCLDLTSLNGDESAAEIAALCAHAKRAQVAAVCVDGAHIAQAHQDLEATRIARACVAMGFPDARGTLDERRQEIVNAVQNGATEIDIVVTTALIEDQDWPALAHEVRVARAACPNARLKVILETGALSSPELIYQSARVALDEGADFIKTSTGKIAVGATIEAAAAMLLALDDHGELRGLKLSGGLRTLDDFLPYYQMISSHWGVHEICAERLRIGASSLLRALEEEVTPRHEA